MTELANLSSPTFNDNYMLYSIIQNVQWQLIFNDQKLSVATSTMYNVLNNPKQAQV
jgi:hypothetical protein